MKTFYDPKMNLQPGGGGLGIAIDKYCVTMVHISLLGARDYISSPRKSVLKHHLCVFRAALAAKSVIADFSVCILGSCAWNEHCGLGSTSAAALGLYHGLNEFLGCPFDDEEIRSLLAFNYVEEDAEDPAKVKYGYETTMTATGAHGGGIFVISEYIENSCLKVIARNNDNSLLGSLPAFILLPNQSNSNVNEVEVVNEDVTICEGAASDESVSVRKRQVFERLATILQQGKDMDLHEFGTIVTELQQIGGKRAEILRRGFEGRMIKSYLTSLRSIEFSKKPDGVSYVPECHRLVLLFSSSFV